MSPTEEKERAHRLQVHTPEAIHGALLASFQCWEILDVYGRESVW